MQRYFLIFSIIFLSYLLLINYNPPVQESISENILNEYPENACTIPMINKNIRSLNLATSVGIVLYEAIRQINEK